MHLWPALLLLAVLAAAGNGHKKAQKAHNVFSVFGASSYDYDDVGRQRIMDEAYYSRRTVTEYNDAALKVTVKQDLKAFEDALLETAPNIGRLKSVSSTAASTTYTLYDALGRVKTNSQTIAGLSGEYEFGYEWYLNDVPKQIRYPSGRLINYEVDDAGRVNLVCGGSCSSSTDTLADMRNPTGITTPYAADGRLFQMKLGNGLFEKRDYQKPGVPTVLELAQR